jgi:SRSO17 transposase
MGERLGAPKKNYIPDDVEFLTKPQIALRLIDEAANEGIAVKAWTFDENYGRDGHFLDGLDERKLVFVGEVPPNFHVWMGKPKVLRKPPRNHTGRPKKYPRLSARDRVGNEVQNLAKYSPCFTQQAPQRYRISDTHKGPEVWDVRWHTCWRKTHDGKLVSSQCTLVVARNVRTGEVKYFLSNRVPGRGGWTLRDILRVAFGRWKVEACFREAKEELGWDHFECRGWGCVHRHLIVTILSQLFCSRVRHRYCQSEIVTDAERLTLEQVRRAADVYVRSIGLPPKSRRQHYQAEVERMDYYQRRNATASHSHHKTRLAEYKALGIDPSKIKSINPKSP